MHIADWIAKNAMPILQQSMMTKHYVKTAKLWSELNNAPILPEHINCQGCRVSGIKTVYCDSLCTIRQCAMKKGVMTCGDCSNFENCQTIGRIITNNPTALENLKK